MVVLLVLAVCFVPHMTSSADESVQQEALAADLDAVNASVVKDTEDNEDYGDDVESEKVVFEEEDDDAV